MNHWQSIVAPITKAQPWLVAVDTVQSGLRRAKNLLDAGAPSVLVIGGAVGTGELIEGIPWVGLGAKGEGRMAAIRASEDGLDAVPARVQAVVDSWDPEGLALAYRAFFGTGRPVASRRCFGARPSSWQALEDKTIVHGLWEEAGVTQAPIRIVAADRSSLETAVKALDVGGGTVLSGDIREGYNGGASYVRWIRRTSDLDEAVAFFGARCDRVRAMPFLEGIPCSIHGFIAGNQFATFRPCEMLVFRKGAESRFEYASTATFWDARPEDTVAMRGVARRVADHLRRTLDYRGAFTVDGVLTAEGFLPTELNPRMGAGFGSMLAGLDIPMELLHLAAVEGLDLDWRLGQLEALVMANPLRFGRVRMAIPEVATSRSPTSFDPVPGGFVEVEGNRGAFRAEVGPAPGGGSHLQVRADSDGVAVGPPFGPRVLEFIRFLDACWDLNVGSLSAATDERPLRPRRAG